MSAGYKTRQVRLWFTSCRTGGLFRPEVRYSANDSHASNSGQERPSGTPPTTSDSTSDTAPAAAIAASAEELSRDRHGVRANPKCCRCHRHAGLGLRRWCLRRGYQVTVDPWSGRPCMDRDGVPGSPVPMACSFSTARVGSPLHGDQCTPRFRPPARRSLPPPGSSRPGSRCPDVS
jgi:hypothetical protein